MGKNFARALLGYFDLRVAETEIVRSPRAKGKKVGPWWTSLLTFLFIVVGVVGKFFFDYWKQSRVLSWPDLIVSLIIAMLIFPIVYRATRARPDEPDLLQYFLAFQNGFFWETLIGQLRG